jgi:hypothetical protein
MCHHRVLLEALHCRSRLRLRPLCVTIFPDPSRCRRRQRRPHPQAWAHNVYSLQHRRSHAIPEPATPSSSPWPQGCIVYFYLSFWAYKSWFWYATLPHCFDMLHCHIALICYIAFLLLHCFDMLHCHIALICYTVTFLRYTTLLLFSSIALMCYIATLLWYGTLPLTCRIALICYIAFDMLHCFWYAALLWYATLPHCSMMKVG